jgi:hypothetical protein
MLSAVCFEQEIETEWFWEETKSEKFSSFDAY